MRILLTTLFLVAAPALAAPEPHGTEQHDDKGHEAAGHGGAESHGQEHDPMADHGHFGHFTADADGDGTANWMDSTNGDKAANPDTDYYSVKRIVFHAINLTILMAILVWFGRRPIGDALATRALGIRKELADSARLRDEAEQRNAELATRLERIESEIEGMRETAATEAAVEEQKLIDRANSEGERIKSAAERTIRDEVTRARATLRADAVRLAVKLAETTLKERVNADTQQKLAKDFLDSIKQGGMNRV